MVPTTFSFFEGITEELIFFRRSRLIPLPHPPLSPTALPLVLPYSMFVPSIWSVILCVHILLCYAGQVHCEACTQLMTDARLGSSYCKTTLHTTVAMVWNDLSCRQ